MNYSLQNIAEHIGGELKGNPNHYVESIGTLATAQPTQLSFLSNNKYLRTWSHQCVTICGTKVPQPERGRS